MRYLLPILFVVFLLPVGCKKDTIPQPADTSTVIIPGPVDSMIGTYSGFTRRIHNEVVYNSPTKYDTSYYTETITISKLNNDSFRLEKNYSSYGSWHSSTFKHSATNKYADGSSSYFNSINFRFLPQNDSLYLYATQSSKTGTGSSYSFTGKKQ